MNYKKIHDAIIENARNQNRTKTAEDYYERHHIIPDFMFQDRSRPGPKGHLPGDPNDPSNIVLLTEREHLLVHVLLAKSLNGKRYWMQAASSVSFFFVNVIGDHPRQKHRQVGASRRYEKYRQLGLDGISAARTGHMPVVDAITGVSKGSVPIDHPKVISGEWQHHSKGRTLTKDHRGKISASISGENNPTYIKVTNEEILKTYTWLIQATGTFVSRPFYRAWFKENFGFSPPNFTSKHRFNYGRDLISTLEEITGFTHNASSKTRLTHNIKDYPYDQNSQN